VEVTSVEQALALARAGAEALQLERFSVAAVAQCRVELDALDLHPLLLAAGGVTEANAAEYARAGADVLVSSAPYQAPPVDVQVLVRKLPAP
jgi:molybdenum transport protein